MTAQELIDKVSQYHRNANGRLIESAYNFAKQNHGDDKRLSGEDFFTHPVAVAEILADHKQEDLVVAAGLLHDTVEDTQATHEDIVREFGDEIAAIVNGVTKVQQELKNRDEKGDGRVNFNQFLYDRTFRTIVDAAGRHDRVAVVKCADRLHNLKTPASISEEKKRFKAREAIELYAPLAEMCGFQKIQKELEDTAFGILQPAEMQEIKRKYVLLRGSKKDPSDEVVSAQKFYNSLCRGLKDARIDAEVTGRLKTPYSTWRKYKNQIGPVELTGGEVRTVRQWLSSVFDVFGFRIVTESVEDAYRALGIVHRNWPAVPGRFKDYISTPKTHNGYRSIHTAVDVPIEMLGQSAGEPAEDLPEKHSVEIQIRSMEMHIHAEYGSGAHWAYRNGVSLEETDGNSVNALQKLIDETLYSSKGEISDAEFKSKFRKAITIRQSSISCYTPRGWRIRLPKKATALDFAFAVHSRIGERAVAAKVRGRRVALHTVLADGDRVEIVTAIDAAPKPEWLEWVVTSRAGVELRRALRRIERQQLMAIGLTIAQEALMEHGWDASEEVLKLAAEKVLAEGSSVDQLLLQLGRTEQEKTSDQSAKVKGGEEKGDATKKDIEPKDFKGKDVKPKDVKPEDVKGKDVEPKDVKSESLTGDEMVRAILPEIFRKIDPKVTEPVNFFTDLPPDCEPYIAHCCLPVPIEDVVGVRKTGGRMLVHRAICKQTAGERTCKLQWHEGPFVPIHPVAVIASLTNRAGVLGRICNRIGEQNSNISDLLFLKRTQQAYLILFEVQVRDTTHLSNIISAIETDVEVKRAYRGRDIDDLRKSVARSQ